MKIFLDDAILDFFSNDHIFWTVGPIRTKFDTYSYNHRTFRFLRSAILDLAAILFFSYFHQIRSSFRKNQWNFFWTTPSWIFFQMTISFEPLVRSAPNLTLIPIIIGLFDFWGRPSWIWPPFCFFLIFTKFALHPKNVVSFGFWRPVDRFYPTVTIYIVYNTEICNLTIYYHRVGGPLWRVGGTESATAYRRWSRAAAAVCKSPKRHSNTTSAARPFYYYCYLFSVSLYFDSSGRLPRPPISSTTYR